MDLLKKELERKKKALKGAVNAAGVNHRFIPAGKLRQLQEDQEEAKREHRKTKRDQLEEEEKKSRNDISRKKKKNDPTKTTAAKTPAEIVEGEKTTLLDSMTSNSLTLELRLFNLPVRLFGEGDFGRQERLKKARQNQKETLAKLSEMEEFRLGKGHGIRNPFLEKDSMAEKNDNSKAVSGVESDKEKKNKQQQSEEDTKDPHKRIYRYFKDLLREWEDDLTKREEDVKRSVAGRNETKTLKQCKDYIRPLFRLCKTRKLEEGLMANILKIVDFCQQGDFVKANDSYMDVAIGRAAWPIGVTMVGIHARTGRAKIESQNVAHVMNSESQRKYLTSVKRLMTYAQNKRTDVNPSKKVMN